jgi:uncharacterized protein (TIGR04222 family)
VDGLAILPFFGLPGPQFLVVYFLICLGSLVGLWAYLRFEGASGAPPQMPVRPDPYEIAYLRGGWREAAVVALYALKKRGAIELDATTGAVSTTAAEVSAQNPVEQAALREIGSGAALNALMKSLSLRDGVEGALSSAIDRMRAAGLIKPSGHEARTFLPGLFVMAALGAYALARIVYAFDHGRHNVAGLVIFSLVAAVAAFVICLRAAQQPCTARGRAYLDQFRVAYSGMRQEFVDHGETNGPSLALVAALGVGALAGTSEGAFAMAYRRHAQPAGSGGDGGGGSSCSSGGGDGGGGGCGGCGGGGD